MRIKITLSADNNGQIDFNYQHQIQSVIYGFLANSNPDYASWLHSTGFVYRKDQRFKLFVYSGIIFHRPINTNNRQGFSFYASKNEPFIFSFQIASPVEKFIQHLVDGIFKEGAEITLGRQKAGISRVETIDPLNGSNSLNGSNGGLLRPLESPLFVKKPMPKGERDLYLFPGDEDYEELLNQNLARKYEALYGKPYQTGLLKFDFSLERLKPFEQKSVKSFKVFKNGKITGEIKGTLLPFTVTGPKELINIGLDCGFGQNNSLGCGYVELFQTKNSCNVL